MLFHIGLLGDRVHRPVCTGWGTGLGGSLAARALLVYSAETLAPALQTVCFEDKRSLVSVAWK